jgi:hypothetical protein
MIRFASLFFVWVLLSFGSLKAQKSQFLVCGDTKLLLVDYQKSTEEKAAIIWEWDSRNASELSDEQKNRFRSLDDCKAVNKGKQILVSSSSNAIALLESKTQKVQFVASVPNAHSIELLPHNRIVAAASTNDKGNKIMLFDLDNPDQVLFEDSLYSAHGVVWVKEQKLLYALGYDVLRAYSFPNPNELKLEKSWKIPGEGGHDLFLSNDRKKLFMTEHHEAWVFDLGTNEFQKIPGFPQAENIKSVSENSAGQFIYTVPEESWWTFHVSFHHPEKKIPFPDMKVYKARWYQ